MEAERGERDALSRRKPGIVQGIAAEGARGAESIRRPGCGGQLDQVTGVGSPAQRLVKLEVWLGLGDRIDQLECLGFRLPGGWVSCDRAANAQAMEGLGWYASEAG